MSEIDRLELRTRVGRPVVVITVQCVSDKNEEAASATIKMVGDNWWLVNFSTQAQFRKIGLGTEIMEQTIAWWDYYMKGEPLYVQVMPYTNRPLVYGDLLCFYKKYGFCETETSSILIRKGSVS